MVISYALGPIALYCMRLELPNRPRPFRLPAARFLCLLAFYFCNLLSYWTGWETISKLAIALTIGLALFTIACWQGKLKTINLGLQSARWLIPYLLGLITISYYGSFGEGRHLIGFGLDFIIIGLFSLIIFYLAIKHRSPILDPEHLDECLAKIALH